MALTEAAYRRSRGGEDSGHWYTGRPICPFCGEDVSSDASGSVTVNVSVSYTTKRLREAVDD